MTRKFWILLLTTLILISLAACDVIAPPLLPTEAPTPTSPPLPTLTPTATLGAKEFINAVFCWASTLQRNTYSLMRFFNNGLVLEAGVEGFPTCQAAWAQLQSYMTLDKEMTFNHGQYHLSKQTIRFELAAPNSTKVVGEVNGTYLGNKMIVTKLGVKDLEYVLVTNP